MAEELKPFRKQWNPQTRRRIARESAQIQKALPNMQKLMRSTKISAAEKLRVMEDVNIDLQAYLMSIGEI